MQHVDEALLHAYLDGALAELAAAGALPPGVTHAGIEAHLAGCGACRMQLEQERALREGAMHVLRDAAPDQIALPPFDQIGVGRDAAPARRRAWVPMAWAASVLLAAGAGWWGSEVLRNDRVRDVATNEAVAPRVSEPAVSEEPAPQADAELQTGSAVAPSSLGFGSGVAATASAGPAPEAARLAAPADRVSELAAGVADAADVTTRPRIVVPEVAALKAIAADSIRARGQIAGGFAPVTLDQLRIQQSQQQALAPQQAVITQQAPTAPPPAAAPPPPMQQRAGVSDVRLQARIYAAESRAPGLGWRQLGDDEHMTIVAVEDAEIVRVDQALVGNGTLVTRVRQRLSTGDTVDVLSYDVSASALAREEGAQRARTGAARAESAAGNEARVLLAVDVIGTEILPDGVSEMLLHQRGTSSVVLLRARVTQERFSAIANRLTRRYR